MSKHTPGPWEATVTTSGKGKVTDRGGFSICNTTAGAYSEQRANARLIAAAPELLEACETFHEWLVREEIGFANRWDRNTEEGEAKWREWYDENLRICALAQVQARAAIAKATGEQ